MSTFWKIFIIVIITAIAVGGGGYYYMDKKTTREKNDLQAQIAILSQEVTDLKAASAPATSTTTAPATTTSWKNYTNPKYGFSLTFNDLWKNFDLVEKSGSDTGAISYLYVCIPTTDSTFQSEKSGMYCPFAITVVSAANKATFDATEDPQKPALIASNSEYAYYYSMSQAGPTDGMSARSDVKNIVATFKAN